MPSPKEFIDHELAMLSNQVVMWRRHFHENPELSFHEVHTSQFVYDTLQEMPNLEVTRPTPTSVMARLIGDVPGKVIALRADMDALPIEEANEFSFASKVPGVMHACGHDGHTAILLGVAKLLSGLKNEINGEIRFLFQHAEELFPGGAEEMVSAGVMEGVDLVLGAHLWASLPVGLVAIAPGPLLAAPDTFRITIIGRGGHAASPNETIDPIAIGAQVVTNLQHVVSRYKDPFLPAVVSVTQFIAGTADNVIPGSAMLAGTVRTFDKELRDQIPEQMKRIVKGVCEAHAATFEFVYQKGYRPVINDANVASQLEASFIRTLGESRVENAEPTMGGEDFSAYLEKAPGAFFFIGAGNERAGITYPHHHPRFTVDEDALAIGVKGYVNAVFDLM